MHTVSSLWDIFTDKFRGNTVMTVSWHTDDIKEHFGDDLMAKLKAQEEAVELHDFMVLPMFAVLKDPKTNYEEELFLTNCVMRKSKDNRELEVVDTVPVTFPKGGVVTGIHLKHAGMVITVSLSPSNLQVTAGDYIHFNNVGVQYGNI